MIISLCLSKRQKGVLIKLELPRKTNVHICSFDFFVYHCFNLTFEKNSDQKEKHFLGKKICSTSAISEPAVVKLQKRHSWAMIFKPLSANFTKWSNILKQFVGNFPTNCLSVFSHFVGLALKRLTKIFFVLINLFLKIKLK